MSYESQALLENDGTFQARDRSCVLQQANTFKDDPAADVAACAQGCLRDDGNLIWAFRRMAAAGPGIADKVDDGAGGIDQSLVTDADLLALTQQSFPLVAELYYAPDGTRLPPV